MTTPVASIIILTKNGGGNFPGLLARIYSQKYDGSYDVLVIDSGSTDGTLEAAKKYPVKLHQIAPREFHHSRTRNLGAELTQGKYLVYVTQDALPLDDSWLQNLTVNFNDPRVSMAVGRQIAWESTRPPEKFFYHYNFPDFKIVVESGADDYYHDNVFISSVNAALRRDTWQRHKFSAEMVMAEDKEIAARILEEGGLVIYEPAAAVYHSHDYGLRGAFEKSLDYGLALRQGASRLPKSNKPLTARMGSYLSGEISYLQANNCWKWIPYSIIYEICKYAGLSLGRAGLLRGPMAGKANKAYD